MSTITQRDEDTTPIDTGLTPDEVQTRIDRGQQNSFDVQVGRTYREIFRYNIFNTFNVVLFVLLTIIIILQDYTTALFAGFSVVMNSIIGTAQEVNAKRQLNQLTDLASQTVKVIRDGEQHAIDRQHIVKDDLVIVEPGDLIPVDGVIVQSDNLEINEAQITGEADAIYKQSGDDITSGSFCITGRGVMQAQQVGKHSTVNRLAARAKSYRKPVTPTQQRIQIIVQFTLVVMFIFLPMLLISGYLDGEPFLELTRNAVVFVTSLVPQGLILIVILSLTVGAVKTSRHETLVQRVNAVESLSNVSVLCFDKTGTLTQNRLIVDEIIPADGEDDETTRALLARYIRQLSHRNSTAEAIADDLGVGEVDDQQERRDEVPFTSQRKWGAVAFDDETLILGAPERVLGEDFDIEPYTRQGLRVLALSRLDHIPSREARHIDGAQPITLVTIRDEVRDDIHETLRTFIDQGVRPKVISGDNLLTVQAVALQVGMDVEQAYTGDDLEAMSDSDFATAIAQATIFARVGPDTKERIVTALRAQGEYVAMVGDGVNDVPALKAADLAVAMNGGAQISKEIADIVLLNDALTTLPLALKEGTETTQTLYGTTKMFLAKNTYNTLLFLFVTLMTLPFPITPIQISWASFGTTNMTGGLIALGILRPKTTRDFRHDVLDYIIIAGVTGGVGMAFLFLTIYNYTDTATARYAITIAFMLYQLNILWNMAGIDLLRPSTLRANPLVVLVSGVLSLGTIGVALTLPDVFEFGLPPPEVLLLVGVVHALMVSLVSVMLRNRGLLHRFYNLITFTKRHNAGPSDR